MKSLLLVAALAVAAAPAAAREVAVAKAPGVGILLFDDKGACPDGSTRSLWVQAEGKVPGCWFEKHERIWLFWDDGDHHGIPRQAFKFESI